MSDPLLYLAVLVGLALVLCAACVWGAVADLMERRARRREKTTACVVIVLRRVEQARADDAAWRAIERAVTAAHFDITADQIRRLPEIQENDR